MGVPASAQTLFESISSDLVIKSAGSAFEDSILHITPRIRREDADYQVRV